MFGKREMRRFRLSCYIENLSAGRLCIIWKHSITNTMPSQPSTLASTYIGSYMKTHVCTLAHMQPCVIHSSTFGNINRNCYKNSTLLYSIYMDTPTHTNQIIQTVNEVHVWQHKQNKSERASECLKISKRQAQTHATTNTNTTKRIAWMYSTSQIPNAVWYTFVWSELLYSVEVETSSC